MISFGKRLERAVEARGFKTLNNFAEHFRESEGLRPSTLADYRGGVTPRPSMFAKLCRLLGIDEQVWRYGSDEDFEAMLAGGTRMPGVRSFRLTSAIEDDYVATGPNAWKHFNQDHVGRAADALDDGRGLRAGKADHARTVELAGIDYGHDLYEVQADHKLPIVADGVEYDALAPEEILVVSPDVQPREGDLVIAKHDEPGALDIKIARYHKAGRVAWILPLDENAQNVRQLANAWEVVGVVVERRRLRRVEHAH